MRRFSFVLIALLWGVLSLTRVFAQQLPTFDVTALANRDGVNVRVAPAIGTDVVAIVDTGWKAPATARSADSQWVRISFNGDEAWVGLPAVTILGDIAILPVADPRSIPYGGFESPRAGSTSADSPISGKLDLSGLRLRAGPSTAYPVLANPLRYTIFPILGRTAANSWFQVNFEGTLGWVKAEWVTILSGNFLDAPIDGIVASTPPVSSEGIDSYIGTLQLMLDRLNIAQESLDNIRAVWTNLALGSRPACQNFPARPTNFNVANAMLAPHYETLNPLTNDFNSAMTGLRDVIDLWINMCSTVGGNAPQPTAQTALDSIRGLDYAFADLRHRLTALIPPERTAGPNECLFTYLDQFDIFPIITIGELYQGTTTKRERADGFCIDVTAGDILRVEVLRVKGDFQPLMSLSPIDNPTQFLAVAQGREDTPLVTLGPLTMTFTGRVLVAMMNTSEIPADARYALLATKLTTLSFYSPSLGYDPVTGLPMVNPPSALQSIIEATPVSGGTTVTVCPSIGFTCSQLLSCQEASACRAAGNLSLDPDNDGIACEEAPLNCTSP